MPKKKKTQLKPVARGFATTSIPKKAIQEEETVPPSTAGDGLVIEATETPADHQAVALQGALPESDSKLANEPVGEQQFLQSLVDKYQEKTEKEISRTIKACT